MLTKNLDRIKKFLKTKKSPVLQADVTRALGIQAGQLSIYLDVLEARDEISIRPIGKKWAKLVELVK